MSQLAYYYSYLKYLFPEGVKLSFSLKCIANSGKIVVGVKLTELGLTGMQSDH